MGKKKETEDDDAPPAPGVVVPIFAVNLRRYRKMRGWTPEQLAKKAGDYIRHDVWRIEVGDTPSPGAQKLYDFARALGVPVGALWANDPDETYYRSLDELLASSEGASITPEEEIELRIVRLPWPISLSGWINLLAELRRSRMGRH